MNQENPGSQAPGWVQEALQRAGEPLSPELEPYLSEASSGMPALRHPLVYQVPYFSQLAWQANDQLAHKNQSLARARQEGDWHSFVFLHERPYRLRAFQAAEQLSDSWAGRHPLDDEAYWELLGDVYADTENFWQESLGWGKALRSGRPHRECFMSRDERQAFRELPDELVLYRGINGRARKRSWAWTLDRDRGIFFAHRLAGIREMKGSRPPSLVTATASRSDAVGYLSRRGESEIVADPAHVTVTRLEEDV